MWPRICFIDHLVDLILRDGLSFFGEISLATTSDRKISISNGGCLFCIMWGPVFFGALILMLSQNLPVDCKLETPQKDGKIAFLFLVRGPMPLEDVWSDFFGWKADPSYYNIYVHTHEHFKYHNTSFFYGKEIQSHDVKWGGMSQVRAIKSLVRVALRDPLNEWFCLMSESCIPLHPFPVWLHAFQGQKKSMINACPFSPEEMETDTRWRPSLDKVRLSRLNCVNSVISVILCMDLSI